MIAPVSLGVPADARRLRESNARAARDKRFQGQYGAARLEAACERAIAHDSPHYRTVKTIPAGGHDLAPVSTITPEPYAGRARFARATASLFEDDGPTFH